MRQGNNLHQATPTGGLQHGSESPKLRLDSTAAIQSQKKLGQGSKLRHIETGAFSCQDLVRSKALELGKILGIRNPANVLIEHVPAEEMKQQLENLDMINLEHHPELRAQLDQAKALHIAALMSAEEAEASESLPHVAVLRPRKDTSRRTPWKPRFATAVLTLHLVAACSLILPAKRQG